MGGGGGGGITAILCQAVPGGNAFKKGFGFFVVYVGVTKVFLTKITLLFLVGHCLSKPRKFDLSSLEYKSGWDLNKGLF